MAIHNVEIVTPRGVEQIALEAASAFGSGKHESTLSCLEEIKNCRPAVPKATFLDVGCGTGILSIAALKLGFNRGVACDTSSKATEICHANFLANKVSDHISVFCGSLDALKEHPFDLLIANIQGDILLELHSYFSALVKTGGQLILSGIAWEYLFDIKRACFKTGFTLVRDQFLEEFATAVFTRNEN